MPVNPEAEARILKAAALMVRAEVVAMLEAHDPKCRGSLQLARFLDEQIPTRVQAALNGVARDVAEAAADAMDSWRPQAPPAVTQRLTLIKNDVACSLCGEVTRAAVHDIQEGELVRVECDACAPELKGPQQ